MNRVYLDNAATTAVRPEVVEVICDALLNNYGNPSSVYSLGRHGKSALEMARKSIAKNLNVSSQEIIFCSGGTEADNWALTEAVKTLKVERIISARTEHHAVLHTLDHLKDEFGVEVEFVKLKKNGSVDISHLSELLSDAKKTLVSIMHVNNETGSMIDIELVGKICKQYNAYFHSDTVQSMGKMNLNFSEINIDFFAASAHKFHGPKGVGFLFVRKGTAMNPMIFGGAQEKGLRAGTESVHNIVGMAKALEMSFESLNEEAMYISELKKYAVQELIEKFPGTKFNGEGNSDNINDFETFHTILNVRLPLSAEKASMLLFSLDMKGIAVSRGSACQSGSTKSSHVLAEILDAEELKKPSIRISFAYNNTKEEIDLLIAALQSV
ncbi:MAG: cysteine desulfurase family protein [Flavobacterium sp.]